MRRRGSRVKCKSMSRYGVKVLSTQRRRLNMIDRRRRSLADHDVGSFNHGGSAVPDLQAKFINCLVRDR